MSNHERNDYRRGVTPEVVIGIGGVAAALTGLHVINGNIGFGEEAAENWSPPPIEQESLDSTSLKDRYGLDVNQDGVIKVYEELLEPDDSASNPVGINIAAAYEELISEGGEGELYPVDMIEPDEGDSLIEPSEGSPLIEPLDPSDPRN